MTVAAGLAVYAWNAVAPRLRRKALLKELAEKGAKIVRKVLKENATNERRILRAGG